jgi:hypothetical protein
MTVSFIASKQSQERKKRRVPSNHIEATSLHVDSNHWKCHHCGNGFPNEGERNNHVRLEHDPDDIAYSEFGPK